MNWRKIFKYLLILLAVSTAVFAFLANQNMIQIYGGKTTVVDPTLFKASNESVSINNVSVLSPDGSTFIPSRNVLIENGVIISIDTISQSSNGTKNVDGAGKFLIPGLIDSHVHLFKSPNDLLLYVANGVTEIRELIGEDNHLKWRQEIKDGRIGPDMYIASPRLGSFGLIEGWWMNWTQGFNNVRDAKEAESMVKAYAKQGYDAVKVYSYLNKESYEAVNKVAMSEGLDVVGHVPFDLELADVLNSNQSDIAHLEELMNAFRREYGDLKNQEGANNFLAFVEKRSKEIAPTLIANDISVTTTLWLTKSFVRQKFELQNVLKEVELEYQNPGISEWDEMIPQGLGWLPEVNRYKMREDLNPEEKTWLRIFWTTYGEACQVILKSLSENGVKIIAGTDTNLPPTVPGFSLHDELATMNAAGMSASQVLQSATSVPAARQGSNTGKIIAGGKANLVLLADNPLEDIANTRSIDAVFLHGRMLDRSVLDQILESVKAANNESRKKDISQFIGDGKPIKN
ncbi:MAG: amidohydrolase family protein [Cyclobacteriaceae bacterium]